MSQLLKNKKLSRLASIREICKFPHPR